MFGIIACKCIVGCALVLTISVPLDGAHANSREAVLYAFKGGSDGAYPLGGLIADSSDNLYGTTLGGGTGCNDYGCGTIFKLAPDGMESVLYAFKGGTDGISPLAGVIADSSGNLYGTTLSGGTYGGGTVFRLGPDGTETVLYSFCAEINCTDGNSPRAGLISDSSGNLYGTTEFGGAYEEGTVFKLAPDGTETVLYSFCAEINCTDGAYPLAGLIMDAAGNLYGMAPNGGTYGGGTVFRLAPDGTETVLYSFCAQTNCTDGGGPTGLIADSSGNLYGTTGRGGEGDCKYGCGTVFKLAPDGTETVLHAFNGGSDGRTPLAGVIADNAGNLYGTTFYGGGTRCHSGCGTVFKLAPDGTETVLFAFHGRRGTNPAGALLKSPHGLLYGTTQFGGASGSYGTIFKIKK